MGRTIFVKIATMVQLTRGMTTVRGMKPTQLVAESTTITTFVPTKCVVSVVGETEMMETVANRLLFLLLNLPPSPPHLLQQEANTTATSVPVAALRSCNPGVMPQLTDSPTGALEAKEIVKLVTVLGVLSVRPQPLLRRLQPQQH